jgi:hypothetical protein
MSLFQRPLIPPPQLRVPQFLRPNDLLIRLCAVGPGLLREPWRSRWSRRNPTTGFCYLLSEVLYHYVYLTAEPYYVKIRGETHWYLVQPLTQGTVWSPPYHQVLDWTWRQFGKRWCPGAWERGRHAAFFRGAIQTPRGTISRRGFELAKLLGLAR